jgi:hypothetical protein
VKTAVVQQEAAPRLPLIEIFFGKRHTHVSSVKGESFDVDWITRYQLYLAQQSGIAR